MISLGFCGDLYTGSSIVHVCTQMGFVYDGLKVLDECLRGMLLFGIWLFEDFVNWVQWDEIVR